MPTDGVHSPISNKQNTELPEWRTPKDPKGLAMVPGGGGRAWPGFETTRRAKLAARTASGRAAAHGHTKQPGRDSGTNPGRPQPRAPAARNTPTL